MILRRTIRHDEEVTMSDADENSQHNPVADNADAEVLPQEGKPSQAEGDDGDAGEA